ncbi:esterase-like activity of phytase family protein [Lyngbya sp. CCY1209]|uniref:esterase-like activity of phytase family protein n=1 Tax=Lyngbya sp. CCY1209 TaxID=2886103 RepID=UPI002D210821|nr:esterase-like activity of phytase family protein [Lyngbya sp. CCY1209]MEB3887456.1 esterase-like activity of phytase family protein [Lyngbya sp. CCY1209]
MTVDRKYGKFQPYAKVSPFPCLRGAIALCTALLLTLLTGCDIPQVSAEQRMFLDLSLEYLGDYQLPEDKPISDLTYEISGYGEPADKGIRFYGLAASDPEFYTLRLEFGDGDDISEIALEDTTILRESTGEPLAVHPRSIVFSPRKSVFVAAATDEPDRPFRVGEYDLETGQLKNDVPLPPTYFPREDAEQGLQPKLGLKSLSIAPDGFSAGGMDPFRLFVAPEAPLLQDLDSDRPPKVRLLHYVIADRASFLVSENLYPFDENSPGTDLAGFVALNRGGSFLSLERSPDGLGTAIYQVFSGDSTDTTRIASLRGELTKVQPLRKQLLLDWPASGIDAAVTAMTLGPRLPDGGQSLIAIADNPTRLFLFRLRES